MNLKPVSARKLRSGSWVVVADGSAPLVMTEELKDEMIHGEIDSCELSLDLLRESGFIADSATTCPSIPTADDIPLGTISTPALWTIGRLSVLTLTKHFITLRRKPLSGPGKAPASVVRVLLSAVASGVLGSIPHEASHIYFGAAWRSGKNPLHVSVLKGTATTSLTHVWTWGVRERLTAVSSGIIIDLASLAALELLNKRKPSSLLSVASSMTAARLSLQLRFHRNCDGRHIAMLLIDNPDIAAECRDFAKTKSLASAPREVKLWFTLEAIGRLIEVSSIFYWIVRPALRMINRKAGIRHRAPLMRRMLAPYSRLGFMEGKP
ncbi:hypothetical protein [Corynebacterium bovis]|uniref:hypothetical protein n=2 Tax=Corynebacterium bovis TaxID=36808 RepID=UPI001124DD01